MWRCILQQPCAWSLARPCKYSVAVVVRNIVNVCETKYIPESTCCQTSLSSPLIAIYRQLHQVMWVFESPEPVKFPTERKEHLERSQVQTQNHVPANGIVAVCGCRAMPQLPIHDIFLKIVDSRVVVAFEHGMDVSCVSVVESHCDESSNTCHEMTPIS